MTRTKYLILGAGPAGLTFANRLLQSGETDFLVLEKEDEAGGLCRSMEVDGGPLDIGGGHFLDVRRQEVNEFLFGFMPEDEWNLFDRDSRIAFEDITIGHPFEANIWQMPQDMQVKYLSSIAIAGCNLGEAMPERFTPWITWKLGKRIAEDYMLPYNAKMFGDELDALGTYWLEKLPNVSFEETLLSCLNRRPYGTQPGHAKFYYPKEYGYGELWLRMGAALGERLITKCEVAGLDPQERKVTTQAGDVIAAEKIIVTIPWTCIRIDGIPEEIGTLLGELKHTAVDVTYEPETMDTPAHWIYYPDPELAYHRILVRSNFATGCKGYWTETNSTRFQDEGKETFHNEYAYPLNTLGKPAAMVRLLDFMKEKGVIGLGRWGEWEHYNSDVTVKRAMDLAEEIL